MTRQARSGELLLMVAGAKGAVASTVAVACNVLRSTPDRVTPYLTTARLFERLNPPTDIRFTGWDTDPAPLTDCIDRHGVVPADIYQPMAAALDADTIYTAPPPADWRSQVDAVAADMKTAIAVHPEARPVMVNLLPAAVDPDTASCEVPTEADTAKAVSGCPDLVYVLAAIETGIPVVNFSPNAVEQPFVITAARDKGVPIAGRDGKTGQTYFKIVLASALRARCLRVDGWYSLNILGNADGKNLMDPEHCAGKLKNKTDILDAVLGYPVGEAYGTGTHRVHIDYYPPRGDAKEAWDVIDIAGLMGLPMSIRVNLQGRDSVLAAPMVIDLACWMTAIQDAGISGPVPELGFYFKKPVGDRPPLTFPQQLEALDQLEQRCAPGPASQSE